MSKVVALYGGSFNLSTLAHRAVGAAVRDIIQPDEVWYLVSPQNPQKTTDHMADFKHRFNMAALNVCGLAKLVVTDIERAISQETGSTASADTLKSLIERYPDTRFVWVMGADNFIKLHTWKNAEYIMDNVPIVVTPRAGYTPQVATCPAAQRMAELAKPGDVKTQRKGWYFMWQLPEGNITATHEREAVNEGHRPDPSHVLPSVADYIARNALRF